jgi:hypothetical protein
MLANAPPVLGRRPRPAFGGPVTANAYGNAGSPDLEINSDIRGAPAAYPGHGLLRFLGGLLAGSSSFGGQRLPQQQQASAWYDPGGPGGAFGGGWADGVLTVRDRHVMTRRGYVRNPGGGGSAMPSPDLDGPPPPRYQMVNTTESWQLGTDHTTQEDNDGQHNITPVLGQPSRRYPLGTQDGTETLVMGPPLGEWREYGVRGVAGMNGPAPDIVDPNRKGSKTFVVTPGAAGMQTSDRRVVYGGVPHGLHSPSENSLTWTGARYASTPQMQPPRVDRPASSKIAGQSMSQGFPPEAAFGASRATPRQAGGRVPGLGARFAGRS